LTTELWAFHGFGFDPGAPLGHKNNPQTVLFPLWGRMMARPIVGRGWYSVPPGAGRVLEAWRAMRPGRLSWNRYAHAWHMAADEGAALAEVLVLQGGPVDLICHSLGSRVVLEALRLGAPNVRRVILLDGAEHCRHAHVVAEARAEVRFLNVAVRADGVLQWLGGLLSPVLGYRATIGHRGLGPDAPANWLDITLDDPHCQAWGRARGWDVRGDSPKRFGDHWYSYRWPGNWPLYQAFLDGSEPTDLIDYPAPCAST
jgi:pimeloyl-ACP methyl ester carboxylesterase